MLTITKLLRIMIAAFCSVNAAPVTHMSKSSSTATPTRTTTIPSPYTLSTSLKIIETIPAPVTRRSFGTQSPTVTITRTTTVTFRTNPTQSTDPLPDTGNCVYEPSSITASILSTPDNSSSDDDPTLRTENLMDDVEDEYVSESESDNGSYPSIQDAEEEQSSGGFNDNDNHDHDQQDWDDLSSDDRNQVTNPHATYHSYGDDSVIDDEPTVDVYTDKGRPACSVHSDKADLDACRIVQHDDDDEGEHVPGSNHFNAFAVTSDPTLPSDKVTDPASKYDTLFDAWIDAYN